MSRRGYTRRQHCAQEGCREVSLTNYEFKRDWADAVQREKGRPPWKCLRHSKPDEVLSADNQETIGVLTCKLSDYGTANWHDDVRAVSGWAHGPGFMAWAKDFPVGTQLFVSTRVVFPDDYVPPEAAQPPSRFVTDAQGLD